MQSKSMKRVCFAVAITAMLLLFGNVVGYCQILSVSIPALHLTGKERIVGFEFHLRSGMIARLPNVPYGWNISIDNDPSWNTTISGSIAVGAAAVDPDFFHDFLTVEVEDNSFEHMPFDLQGEVFVTEDFVANRRIKLVNKDFVFKTVIDKKSVVQKNREQ
jgi:hypothetical protein